MSPKIGVAAAFLVSAVFAFAGFYAHVARADGGAGVNTTCTATLPCVTDSNSSSGAGLKTSSATGNGLIATTKAHGSTSTNGRSAVLGQDIQTTTGNGMFNFGVTGTSTNGTGVHGSGGLAGVTGTATSATGIGLLATATDPNASLIEGQNQNGPAFHVDGGGNVSLAGVLTAASTIFAPAFSNNGAPLYVFGTLNADDGIVSTEPLSSNTNFIATDRAGVTWLYQGYSTTAGKYTIEMGDSGSIYARIFLTMIASKVAQQTSTGTRVDTYTPQTSEPSLEDFGEAQLDAGSATVSLDPRFAAAMDRTTRYLVTVTPNGDCRGLYVAQRNAASFVVRELQGGRSSISFTYRIMARPLGNSGARLAQSQLPYGFEHNVPPPVSARSPHALPRHAPRR